MSKSQTVHPRHEVGVAGYASCHYFGQASSGHCCGRKDWESCRHARWDLADGGLGVEGGLAERDRGDRVRSSRVLAEILGEPSGYGCARAYEREAVHVVALDRLGAAVDDMGWLSAGEELRPPWSRKQSTGTFGVDAALTWRWSRGGTDQTDLGRLS